LITDIKPGTRLRSSVCDVEVIVVKTSAQALDLRCGGHPMVPTGGDCPEGLVPKDEFTAGTQIGKRYSDESGELELLCTKAGSSSLSIGDTPLKIKEAKPLPSSD
jgi:hypothetical protein